MIKYVRTKTKIEEIRTRLNNEKLFNHLKQFDNYKDDLIKVSDTIEELCDEFVIIDEDNEPNIKQGRDIHHCRRIWAINNCLIYGAIWTDKGLIYVAKMNDKGELELL